MRLLRVSSCRLWGRAFQLGPVHASGIGPPALPLLCCRKMKKTSRFFPTAGKKVHAALAPMRGKLLHSTEECLHREAGWEVQNGCGARGLGSEMDAALLVGVLR